MRRDRRCELASAGAEVDDDRRRVESQRSQELDLPGGLSIHLSVVALDVRGVDVLAPRRRKLVEQPTWRHEWSAPNSAANAISARVSDTSAVPFPIWPEIA